MPYKILTPIRVWGLFFIHLRFLAAVTPYVQEKFACLCDFPENGSYRVGINSAETNHQPHLRKNGFFMISTSGKL